MNDDAFMQQALRLARRGQGRVEPNPMVGCLIVRDGRVLGRGYHRRIGGPHAEIAALEDCRKQSQDARDATVYVTLEPCCHQGRTPPCVDALLDARPQRVVVAIEDPFDQVHGHGIESLRGAGIQVSVGPGREDARSLNAPYLKRLGTGLPWTIVKWAQSLDGRIATSSGDSRWISSEASRRNVHLLRARVDAVVVGIGTVIADDPTLTARGVSRKRVARRVVVDPSLRLPPAGRLMETLADAPLSIACGRDANAARAVKLESAGVELIRLPSAPPRTEGAGRRLTLRPLLEHLASRHGATNVLVEGGGRLTGGLFLEDLVDQVLTYVAPSIMGDAAAIPAVSGLAPDTVRDARRLQLAGVRRREGDVELDYRVVR
jgi:diaminohydroxyphosphoribosylaminopyrimidine deaminase/5-amino-6-(5-phosphoribosylamino)uracil reductase